MSRFTPRYNKKVTMASCSLTRKTSISAVEGLKMPYSIPSKGLKDTVQKKKLIF